MNTNNQFDCIGFGLATLDYICLVDEIANYDQSIMISDIKFLGGGVVPTALAALQRLGGKSSFISLLGDDWIGKEIIKGLKQEGIDCSGVGFTNKALSTFSFIQVNNKSGKRAIACYPGSSLLLKFEDKDKGLVKKGRILHLDGVYPVQDLAAAEFAKKNNVKVMLDASLLLEGTNKLLSSIDYLIISESFLLKYSKNKDIVYSLNKIYSEYKPEILVTTLGERGSAAFIDGEVVYIDAFSIDAVDTTGAGDVYHGAFIFGLTKNWDLKDIIIFSSAVAALKCRDYGGRKGIPDYKTTLNFLNEKGFDINRLKQ